MAVVWWIYSKLSDVRVELNRVTGDVMTNLDAISNQRVLDVAKITEEVSQYCSAEITDKIALVDKNAHSLWEKVSNDLSSNFDNKLTAVDKNAHDFWEKVSTGLDTKVDRLEAMWKSAASGAPHVTTQVVGAAVQVVKDSVSSSVQDVKDSVSTRVQQVKQSLNPMNWNWSATKIALFFAVTSYLVKNIYEWYNSGKFHAESGIRKGDSTTVKVLRGFSTISTLLTGIGLVLGSLIGFEENATWMEILAIGNVGKNIIDAFRKIVVIFKKQQHEKDSDNTAVPFEYAGSLPAQNIPVPQNPPPVYGFTTETKSPSSNSNSGPQAGEGEYVYAYYPCWSYTFNMKLPFGYVSEKEEDAALIKTDWWNTQIVRIHESFKAQISAIQIQNRILNQTIPHCKLMVVINDYLHGTVEFINPELYGKFLRCSISEADLYQNSANILKAIHDTIPHVIHNNNFYVCPFVPRTDFPTLLVNAQTGKDEPTQHYCEYVPNLTCFYLEGITTELIRHTQTIHPDIKFSSITEPYGLDIPVKSDGTQASPIKYDGVHYSKSGVTNFTFRPVPILSSTSVPYSQEIVLRDDSIPDDRIPAKERVLRYIKKHFSSFTPLEWSLVIILSLVFVALGYKTFSWFRSSETPTETTPESGEPDEYILCSCGVKVMNKNMKRHQDKMHKPSSKVNTAESGSEPPVKKTHLKDVHGPRGGGMIRERKGNKGGRSQQVARASRHQHYRSNQSHQVQPTNIRENWEVYSWSEKTPDVIPDNYWKIIGWKTEREGDMIQRGVGDAQRAHYFQHVNNFLESCERTYGMAHLHKVAEDFDRQRQEERENEERWNEPEQDFDPYEPEDKPESGWKKTLPMGFSDPNDKKKPAKKKVNPKDEFEGYQSLPASSKKDRNKKQKPVICNKPKCGVECKNFTALMKHLKAKHPRKKSNGPIQKGGGESASANITGFDPAMLYRHSVRITALSKGNVWFTVGYAFRYGNLLHIPAHCMGDCRRENLMTTASLEYGGKKYTLLHEVIDKEFTLVSDINLYQIKPAFKVVFENIPNSKFSEENAPENLEHLQIIVPHKGLCNVRDLNQPEKIAAPKEMVARKYLADYSSDKGDSGALIWGYNSKQRRWVPCGFHYGDEGKLRAIFYFLNPAQQGN